MASGGGDRTATPVALGGAVLPISPGGDEGFTAGDSIVCVVDAVVRSGSVIDVSTLPVVCGLGACDGASDGRALGSAAGVLPMVRTVAARVVDGASAVVHAPQYARQLFNHERSSHHAAGNSAQCSASDTDPQRITVGRDVTIGSVGFPVGSAI